MNTQPAHRAQQPAHDRTPTGGTETAPLQQQPTPSMHGRAVPPAVATQGTSLRERKSSVLPSTKAPSLASRIASFARIGASLLANPVAREVAAQASRQWRSPEAVFRPNDGAGPYDVPAAIFVKEALAQGARWQALKIECSAFVPDAIRPLADAMSANQTVTSFTAHLTPPKPLRHDADACTKLAASLLAGSSPITTLRLSGLNADEGCTAFINTLVTALPSARALRELHLPGCSINADQAVPLAGAAKKTALEVLDLSNNPITSKGVAAIADFLKESKSLRRLDLDAGRLGDGADEAVERIADALKTNTSLQRLSLASWQCDRKGDAAMAEAIKVNKALRDLTWRSNQSFAGIAEALKSNSTLTRLDVRDIAPSAGAQVLATALRDNTGLRTLLLGTSIDGKSAVTLAQSLRENQTLENLDLSDGFSGNPFAIDEFLITLLNNTSLRRLSVAGVQMNLENIRTVATYLADDRTELQALDLSSCPIGDEAAAVIADALKANTSLRLLVLIKTDIGDEGRAALSAATGVRPLRIDWRASVNLPFEGIDSTTAWRPAIRRIMLGATPLPAAVTQIVTDYLAAEHGSPVESGLLFPDSHRARWEESERKAI